MIVLFWAALICPKSLTAATGSSEASPLATEFEALGVIEAIAAYTNGTILVGGHFNRIGSLHRTGCVLLDGSGIPVPGFDASLGPESSVASIGVMPDGRILVAGYLTSRKLGGAENFALLLPNGDRDPSFESAIPYLLEAPRIAVSRDRSILAGGYAEGRSVLAVFKLGIDGRHDESFSPFHDCWAGATVPSLALLPHSSDHRVYVAGNFERFGNSSRNYLARLRRDGTPDASFDIARGPDGVIQALASSSNERLLIGGYFTHFNHAIRPGIARLESDGTLDLTFRPDPRLRGSASSILELVDGRILVGGRYWIDEGSESFTVIRLHGNGDLDPEFKVPYAGTSYQEQRVNALLQTERATVWIGGGNVGGNELGSGNPLRQVPLLDNGSAGQPPQIVRPGYVGLLRPTVDRRILAAGSFDFVNGLPRAGIVRLLENGSVDTTFVPPRQLGDYIWSMMSLPDGSVLIGGDFEIEPPTRQGVLKLRSNGDIDTDFTPPNLGGNVRALQSDSIGEILAGGEFHTTGQDRIPGLVRLRANGEMSQRSFSQELDLGSVFALSRAADGRVYVGGNFGWSSSGGRRKYLTRLTAEGNADPGFRLADENAVAAELNSIVTSLAFDSRGRLVVGGWFTAVGSRPAPGIVVLLPEGRIDPEFRTQFDGSYVEEVWVDEADRIVARGEFRLRVDGPSTSTIRILPDGSLDDSFSVAGFDVTSVMVRGNEVVAGGLDRSLGDRVVTRIMRVGPAAVVPKLLWSWNPEKRELVVEFPEGAEAGARLEGTDNWREWHLVATEGPVRRVILNPSAPAPAARFFRLHSR